MPKEKISKIKDALPEASDPGETPERTPTVQVGWTRDGWVQVSVEGDPSYFQFAANAPDPGDGRCTVYSDSLDREELNKLIRVLRRARDQAFGRDE